ncbi:hypothetical protein LY76DRAFT_481292, partial [Colletotrichum caudatum]
VIKYEAFVIINDYYQAWRKLDPGAKFPEKLAIYSSGPDWPSFKKTAFYKAVGWTFEESRKTVEAIYI